MNNIISKLFESQSETKALVENSKKNSKQLVSGITPSARAAQISGLFLFKQQLNSINQLLVVTDNLLHAQQLIDELVSFVGEEYVYLFDAEENLTTETSFSSSDSQSERVQTLSRLVEQKNLIVVSTLSGIKKIIGSPSIFKSHVVQFKTQQEYSFENIKQQLVEMGYQKNKTVEARGEFASRGSLIDIFPFNEENPIRFDFFGDELESIKYFDLISQRSIKKTDSVTIFPATDTPFVQEELVDGIKKIRAEYEKLREVAVGANKKKYTDYFEPLIEQISHGEVGNEAIVYHSILFNQSASIVDYFDQNAVIIYDEFARTIDFEKRIDEKNANWLSEKSEQYQAIPLQSIKNSLESIERSLSNPQIYFSSFQRGLAKIKFTRIAELVSRPVVNFFGQIDQFKNELDFIFKKNFTVIATFSTINQKKKFIETLLDFGIKFIEVTQFQDVHENIVNVVEGQLYAGFEIDSMKLTVITQKELLKANVKRNATRKALTNAEKIQSYDQLSVGDYVVHVNHGIGRYNGIKNLESYGTKQDYLEIDFAKNAKIFVPVTQFNLVQKYMSSGNGKIPKIDSLSSTDWIKRKHETAKKIEDIADDLLALYSTRETQSGFAFSPEDEQTVKFDEDFPYVDTPDQIRSTQEIKKAMEQPKPMDRLLVGDVGFGKTEVAMRAAFKAFKDNKQVAFLAPTTILVQQHFEALKNRFAQTSARIGMLSRFQTQKENKLVVQNLADHKLDIVVGTHRLFSQDVKFADLGLLIIDEEQRFGVKHKERLKQLKENVDVLTLTATPIPRTLNMAMVGARDLSVLETPPQNRFPIQTYVIESSWAVVVDAIQKELQRDGQVFYVHNRVSDIERTASQLQELVPEARVSFIHGQMTEVQLETVLYAFLNNEFDVLVTTTIIETGIDIPNANTLIIENSQNFGLSQLYQLRGRVGRSNRIAYAYFTYPADRQPTEEAQKRLEAVRDFTELGSGFKLAMRDLSIRGAGDFLGKQQHGFIDMIGYELYQQMLSEAIEKKKGEKNTTLKTDAEILINVDAFLPQEYVPDTSQKIDLYTRLREVKSLQEVDDIQQEMQDRFGEEPQSTKTLLNISKIKFLSDRINITSVKSVGEGLTILFNGENNLVLNTLERKKVKDVDITFKQVHSNLEVDLHFENKTIDQQLAFLIDVLSQLQQEEQKV